MKQMKRMVLLLLTVVFAISLPLSAFAAGTIEVTEDVSVSDDYDWTRFKGQNVTLNVYNWGEYISNGSDELSKFSFASIPSEIILATI